MPTRLGIRIVAIAAASLAYILGCHWLMTRAEASPWNAVFVLTPMLVAVAVGAWRGAQQVTGALATAAIVGLVGLAVFGVQLAPERLYLAQHVGIHLALAFAFGSTLRAGRTPLITTIAQRVHSTFTADMARYTRKSTVAWVLYFVGMAVASVGLFAAARFDTWALFANLLTPLTLVAMFVGEYVLRYWLHPEFERASFADAIRSYRHAAK